MYRIILLVAYFSSVLSAPRQQFDFESINDFSFNLLDNIAAVQEGNFGVSALSVWNLFSLLAEGAAGSTFNELMLQLKLPKDLKATQALHQDVNSLLLKSNNDVKFNRKAAIFADCSLEIHQEFCQSAFAYNTDVYRVDSLNKTKLADDINYYVCVATEGNIRGIVDVAMLENLRLILLDAMFFKANWTHAFDPSETHEDNFYDHHGRKIGTVNMMHQKASNIVSYIDELQAEAIELSYGKNEELAMIILIPYQGNTIKKLLKSLTQKSFNNWISCLSDADSLPEIDCYVPRFKISSRIDLIKPLNYMGIIDIFDEMKAQLPGVADVPLYVTKTVQKVELEVTEDGTKAGVASVVGLEDRILGQRIEVNKPFVFLIVEKNSNVVLFSGVYMEPSLF